VRAGDCRTFGRVKPLVGRVGRALHSCEGITRRCGAGAVRPKGWRSSFLFSQPPDDNTNNIGDDEPPAQAGDVNVGGAVLQLTAGSDHSCALLSAGNVRCWGIGGTGRSFRNGAWQGWDWLGGNVTEDVGAVSSSDGNVQVFVRGTEGVIYNKSLQGSTWWPYLEGWDALGAETFGTPTAISIASGSLGV
jgi:hypothetical protein